MDISDEHLTVQERFNLRWRTVQPTINSMLDYLDDGLTTKNTGRIMSYADQMVPYNVVYKLSLESDDLMKKLIYEKHHDLITQYVQQRMLPRIQHREGTQLLKAFVDQWEVFKVLNRWMAFFFRYMDNFYVKQKKTASSKEQALSAFKSNIFDVVQDEVTQAIIKIINSDRDGQVLDSNFDLSYLRKATEVYRAMEHAENSVYISDFEQPYIADGAEYYARKSQQWLESNSTPEYLRKAEDAINSEARRVAAYFLDITRPKVCKTFAETLLKTQQKALLENANSGFEDMLNHNKKEDLARVFRLFVQVDDAIPSIAQMLHDHIQKEGKVILDQRAAEIEEAEAKEAKESTNDAEYVQKLLALHQRYQSMVAEEFQNNFVFQNQLKRAFEATVNTDIGKKSNAELLSTHADSVLKSGGGEEKLSEAQIEDVLEKVVQLFSFISDKDVFADVYRNHLAKRLLNQRSASPFAERSMIQKLKMKCGAHFTSKFEGMLNDFELGKDGQRKFSEFIAKKPSLKLPIDFSCDVLTTGHWPSYKILLPTLPSEMANCIDVYTAYYEESTDHRKLTWVHSLGSATVKANFKVSYDLQVSTLQALTMLIFNRVSDGKTSLTFRQVNELLGGLELDIVKKVLHSLSCQKLKVLVKEPDSKKIEETDSFRVATEFQSKIRKVRIPMPSLEDSHNPQRVEEDRGLAVEAAIVRIMKARKRLQHNLLVTEVVNQLRTFRPAPKLIKKKIEHLIEREYLKRDEAEANFYQYLA